MESIASGVHTLPLDFEWDGTTRTIHPAVVETASGLILVDTGLPDHVNSIDSLLTAAGFAFADVQLVVLTHQDVDHAGGLDAVRERSGATTLAHTADAPFIAGERELLKGGDYPPVSVDIELVDGVTISTAAGPMRVVATPGHSPGHISLHLPDERLLIAGDAITAEDAFDGPNEAATPDMARAIDSIGRLAELDVVRTLCFHGGLVEHDPDRIAAIHESLRGRVD